MRTRHQPLLVCSAIATALVALGVLTAGTRNTSAKPVFGSSYSSAAAANCWSDGKKEADDRSSRVCRGKSGLVVSIDVVDMRQTVSIGHNLAEAAKEPAAEAWFGPFNSAAPRIEWRMAGSEPFAIIQRWQIADPSNQDKGGRLHDKALLVVTRLSPGGVCHVAYVDVAANPDANDLARQAADESARSFACGKDQVKVIGKSGRAAELAMQH
jgi:hypothetical protein